jgi:hypothetical protein
MSDDGGSPRSVVGEWEEIQYLNGLALAQNIHCFEAL